jgi:hypothetical protein
MCYQCRHTRSKNSSRLLRRRPVTGGDVFDLQILAAMNVNGIQRIYTFNAGAFASFPEIAVLTP